MANLLRRIVEKSRSKSRSKSPTKRPTTGTAEHEFEHWTRGHTHHLSPAMGMSAPAQRLPPMIRTQYVDEEIERFQPPYLSAYGPWHGGGTSASAIHDDMASTHTLTATMTNGWGNGTIHHNPRVSHHSSNSLLPPLSAHNNSSTDYINLNSNMNTLNRNPSQSRESVNGFHQSSSRLAMISDGEFPDQTDFGSRLTLPQNRLRSESPQKSPREFREHRPRSRSPKKKPSSAGSQQSQTIRNTFDYLHSQCKLEGCSASIVVDDARFLVCKHQLAHVSEFFRTLFINNRALPPDGVKQFAPNEYTIVVSSLRYPPQCTQFQWFVECTVPGPVLRDITDDTLETCMRLSKRFTAKGLEVRCAKYIRENVDRKPPMTALCWLNWALKHRFDRAVQDACLVVAARLPLVALEKHRQMITEKLLADLLAMKLRACFKQTASVFHTIHKMDHFHVEVEKCPRCSRSREQGRIRLLANPCQKLIGCDRCLKDLGCEIESRSQDDFQAFYNCEHRLMAFNDETEDCVCQSKLYRRRIDPPSTSLTTHSDSNVEFDGEPTLER